MRLRPRMRWRSTGVWPTGAQVRRTGGTREAPDSSTKQVHAPQLSAPLDPWPVLGAPAGDGVLVALGGAPRGPLRAPLVAAQQPPHLPGMVADPGQPPDHLGDPRQGPQVGVKSVGFGTGQQGPLHSPPVAVRQAGGAAPPGPGRPPPPAAPAPAGGAPG